MRHLKSWYSLGSSSGRTDQKYFIRLFSTQETGTNSKVKPCSLDSTFCCSTRSCSTFCSKLNYELNNETFNRENAASVERDLKLVSRVTLEEYFPRLSRTTKLNVTYMISGNKLNEI